MEFYKTKFSKLSGTSYEEVYKHAREVMDVIKHRTKRKPYVRSAYFNKQKIFFDNFWVHMSQKLRPERFRRLKFFVAAIELVQSSRLPAEVMPNPSKQTELLYRMGGETKDGFQFCVQIKENIKTGKRQLMSIFPVR